ncbi:mitochondrial translation release factor in rescue-like [Anopheles bellator]|uniref:mitochondrial translation release factor in rescue-like n=1 Tax=Anopheles bellator TaxID=139047 RepID=UPI0026495ED5|nr:mitochondrial translation release factor in rescue-like [Anopheles bellator]
MHCFHRLLPVVSGFSRPLPFSLRPIPAGWRTFSKSIDDTRVPVLHEEDLEESFVRGSGPGGQSVAKTNNKVVLTHKPTGLVVHCHTSRSLFENRREARKLLVARLDQLLNGEQSVAGQRKVIEQRKHTESLRRKMRLQAKKKAWKEREATEGSKDPSPQVE